jgi:hypothetical protein
MTNIAYRFRLFTADSIGAYTIVYASTQYEALADLRRQLAPWEQTVPLHGPNRNSDSFI